jgi:hypothetical protein
MVEDCGLIGVAFEVRLPGAALVVNFGFAAMIVEGTTSGPAPLKYEVSKMTTKAAPNQGAQKAVAISTS